MSVIIQLCLAVCLCGTSLQSSHDLSWKNMIRNHTSTIAGVTNDPAERTPPASIKVEDVFTKRPTIATEPDTTPTVATAAENTEEGSTAEYDTTEPTVTASTTAERRGTIKLSNIFDNRPSRSTTTEGTTVTRATITAGSNGGDSSDILEHDGYCCKKALVMESENRTKVVKVTKIEQVQLVVGYKSCLTENDNSKDSGSHDGTRRKRFFWGGRDNSSQTGEKEPKKFFEGRGCPIFRTENVPVEKYTVETFQVPINIMQCVGPITCCQGYIRLQNGQCQHEEFMSKHKDTIDALRKLGLIG